MAHINIYDLKIHEETHLPGTVFSVLRVPGGWIYTRNIENNTTSTFVPHSDDTPALISFGSNAI